MKAQPLGLWELQNLCGLLPECEVRGNNPLLVLFFFGFSEVMLGRLALDGLFFVPRESLWMPRVTCAL